MRYEKSLDWRNEQDQEKVDRRKGKITFEIYEARGWIKGYWGEVRNSRGENVNVRIQAQTDV
jgi:DNA primase